MAIYSGFSIENCDFPSLCWISRGSEAMFLRPCSSVHCSSFGLILKIPQVQMEVSWNGGSPKSSKYNQISINEQFWGSPISTTWISPTDITKSTPGRVTHMASSTLELVSWWKCEVSNTCLTVQTQSNQSIYSQHITTKLHFPCFFLVALELLLHLHHLCISCFCHSNVELDARRHLAPRWKNWKLSWQSQGKTSFGRNSLGNLPMGPMRLLAHRSAEQHRKHMEMSQDDQDEHAKFSWFLCTNREILSSCDIPQIYIHIFTDRHTRIYETYIYAYIDMYIYKYIYIYI